MINLDSTKRAAEPKAGSFTIEPIAYYHSEMKEKFGLPRQAGLVESLPGRIVFEPAFRDKSAFRGMEAFTHLWLIWGFSESRRVGFQPTVRPPRLHGNERMGVFATRSPFRPNALGLSAVRLAELQLDAPEGPILLVSGADLLNGSPIFDIKPYIPYADCIADAGGGFAETNPVIEKLDIVWPAHLSAKLPTETEQLLRHLLELDPRPAYQNDPDRIYGMRYGPWNVRFCVENGTVHVLELEELAHD